jgi:hypothetical protein
MTLPSGPERFRWAAQEPTFSSLSRTLIIGGRRNEVVIRIPGDVELGAAGFLMVTRLSQKAADDGQPAEFQRLVTMLKGKRILVEELFDGAARRARLRYLMFGHTWLNMSDERSGA